MQFYTKLTRHTDIITHLMNPKSRLPGEQILPNSSIDFSLNLKEALG